MPARARVSPSERPQTARAPSSEAPSRRARTLDSSSPRASSRRQRSIEPRSRESSPRAGSSTPRRRRARRRRACPAVGSRCDEPRSIRPTVSPPLSLHPHLVRRILHVRQQDQRRPPIVRAFGVVGRSADRREHVGVVDPTHAVRIEHRADNLVRDRLEVVEPPLVGVDVTTPGVRARGTESIH